MRKYLLLIPILLCLAFTTKYPYPKVYVEWVDIIATDQGWHASSDIDYWARHESDTVKQLGFLYRETQTHVILVDSFISADYVGAATKIPKGNIIKIKRIP